MRKARLFGLLALFWTLFLPRTSEAEMLFAVQPLDSVPEATVNVVKRGIETMFGVKVHVLPRLTGIVDTAPGFGSRGYAVEKFLPWMDARTPATYHKIVAVTKRALIATTERDLRKSIAGYGLIGQRPCVLTTTKLLKPGTTAALFQKRTVKVANHELGHTFGLDHCRYENCLMADMKRTLKTLDRRGGEFCSTCRRKLQMLLYVP
jgi:archaemetzincin